MTQIIADSCKKETNSKYIIFTDGTETGIHFGGIRPFACNELGNAVSSGWESWLRSFNLYLDLKRLSDAKLKKSCLLHSAGPQVQEVFYNLPDEEEDDSDKSKDEFEKAVKKLDAYFMKQKNYTYERHVFRNVCQKPNEPFDQFIIRLRKQASRCNFKTLADDQIKDQIIEKCRSSKLKEKVLEAGDKLTLTETIEMGLALETVLETVKVFQATPTLFSPVNKIDAKPKRFVRGRDGVKCSRCGRSGHDGGETCPAKMQTCHRCKRPGHFSVMCKTSLVGNSRGGSAPKRPRMAPSRSENNYNIDSEPENSSDKYIFAIGSDEKQENEVNCSIGQVSVRAVIDSGCQYNLIDEKSWNLLKAKNVQVSNMKRGSDKILRAYGGRQLKITGVIEADLQMDGVKSRESFIVMEETGRILIGSQTAKNFGILQIKSNASDVSSVISINKPEKLNKINNISIKLVVDKTVSPVQQQYRRVPVALEEKVNQKLGEMVKRDIIEKVEVKEFGQRWISPMVIVPKSHGDVRICLDMRQANKAIQREPYPLPIFEDMLPHIGQGKWFSKLDIEQAFHQMELEPNSRDITTFITMKGLFRFKRLMMGISCAPELFQKHMEIILAGCPGTLNFIDDIIIYGSTRDEHDSRLAKTLKVLEEANVSLNQDKCIFGARKLDFLGHQFTGEGIKPSEAKLAAVRKFREPRSAEETRSFLGLITYLGKYIPDLATTTDPLRQLIKKETKFEWKSEHQQAFEKLKNCLSNESILGYFDPKDRTRIVADASPVGLGAVLVQIGSSGPRVIAFASKSLTETEKRYCQTEKEALAIVWSIEKFHFYLLGLDFELITDHKPLEVIFGVRSKPCARIERWVLRLQCYRFKVIYKSGKSNIADVFSRLCQSNSDEELPVDKSVEQYVSNVIEYARPVAVTLMEIQEASRTDSEIQWVKEAVDTGNWPENVSAYKFCENEYCVSGDILLRGTRIVIPKVLQEPILKLAHEGHPGITVMKRRLRSKVWWPKIDAMAQETVTGCEGCLAVSVPAAPEPLVRRAFPSEPWRQLALDLLGPLPSGHHLLVVIDYFSRYIEIEVLTRIDSSEIIKRLKVMWARFGIPHSITLDNGRQFTSEEFHNFAKTYNIQLLHTTPYWPQMNGEVERQNRSILKRIKISHQSGREWRDDLTEYLLMYRATEHSVTGKSPGELLFGRKMRDKLPEISQPLETVVDTFEDVRDLDKINKEKGKEYTDRKRKAKPNDIQLGETVVLKNMVRQNKLTPTFGSEKFKVIDRKGSEITVKAPDGPEYKRNVSHAKVVGSNIKETLDSEELIVQKRPVRNTRPPQRYQ